MASPTIGAFASNYIPYTAPATSVQLDRTGTLSVVLGASVYVFIGYAATGVSGALQVATVTDSAGNLYRLAGRFQNNATSYHPALEIWYADNVPPNSNLVVTVTFSTATFCAASAVEISGANFGGSLDAISRGHSGNTPTSAPSSLDPVTTTNPNDLLVACLSFERGIGTTTSASGWTEATSEINVDGPNDPGDMGIIGFWDVATSAGTFDSKLYTGTSKPYSIITVAIRPWPPSITELSGLSGRPSVTVSPRGIANGTSLIINNGADFGPDTLGTKTSGIQEALESLGVAGGLVQLLPGTFEVSAPQGITIPACNGIVLQGSGSTMTTLEDPGGTLIVDTSTIDSSVYGVLNYFGEGSTAIRDLSVAAYYAQYAINWFLNYGQSNQYNPAMENDTAILQLFENVEATAAASETQANYGWHIWGYEQTLFLSCGSGFSIGETVEGQSIQSGWGIYVSCTAGNTRFIACDFQGQVTLDTQEANLYETTVEHAVVVNRGRFFMFGGALYDAGPGWGTVAIYGGHCPGNGPCLQNAIISPDVMHCIGVVFNCVYQNYMQASSGAYVAVLPQGNSGTNVAPYNKVGAANAEGMTFESCIFNLNWPDNSPTVPAYVVGTPSSGTISCVRVLRQCVFTNPTSAPRYGAAIYVLQTNGNAVVENCTYLNNAEWPIVPPTAGASATIGASGVVETNANYQAIEIYLPVTYGTAGTFKVSIGPSGTPSLQIANESGGAGETRTFRFRVPAGWSYVLTYSSVTLGTATVIEM